MLAFNFFGAQKKAEYLFFFCEQKVAIFIFFERKITSIFAFYFIDTKCVYISNLYILYEGPNKKFLLIWCFYLGTYRKFILFETYFYIKSRR